MDWQELLGNGKLTVDLIGSGVDLANKVRKAFDKADTDTSVTVEMTQLVDQLRDKLVDAQTSQLTLQSMLLDLKQEMMEHDRRLELSRRYEALRTNGGALVLSLRTSEAGGEPHHYICPDCAEQGARSFLQPQGTGKRCNPCGKFFEIEPESRWTPPSFSRGGID